MSQSGNSSFSSSRLSIFGSPRPAPPAPSPSDDIQGFVVPVIPPPDCPLHMVATPDGLHLPRVSANAHPPTHRRVPALNYLPCQSRGASRHPLPSVRSFRHSRLSLRRSRRLPLSSQASPDAVFRDERTALVNAVHDNHLPASLFAWEYGRATAHFYSAAQGAIDRFIINYNATHRLSLRGYRALANATTDAGLLSRFMALGAETQVHRSVLQVVANRLLSIITNIVDPLPDNSPILPL
ncbi:hypothetical protein MSAN_02203400 [Mycena sanguinolenta]|uniref:Uncharacterized protein n=1 Tax=Mycena sanguinolenta TaxID=230812 RepID=A0A8H6XCX9_9AGAR|nr:hypothetical protein MSAN_02203400 [Mycena sanguinolenta]